MGSFPRSRALPIAALAALFAFLATAVLAGQATATDVTEDWYIDGPQTVTNDDFVMHANLIINSTGQLSVARTKFTFVSTATTTYGVLVKSQGYLVLDSCTIVAGEESPGSGKRPWTFWARDMSRLSIRRSSFSECGILGASPEQQGLAVQTNNAGFFNCTFKQNNVGIVLMSGANPTVEDCLFEFNSYAGILANGPTLQLEGRNRFVEGNFGLIAVTCASLRVADCTFTDTVQASVSLVESSGLVTNVTIDGPFARGLRAFRSVVRVDNSSIRTPIDQAQAFEQSQVLLVDCALSSPTGGLKTDATSWISVRQTVTFKVVYEGADLPVENAQVSVTDKDGSEMVRVGTDTDGRSAPRMLETHYVTGLASIVSVRVPLTVIANKGTEYVRVYDYSPPPNALLRLEFKDPFPPQLIVTSPTDGSVFRTTTVRLKGSVAEAQSGLGRLYYTVNGGEEQDLPALATFELDVELPEGELSIDFYAVDRVGNVANVTRAIVVDVTPPGLTGLSPANNTVTRAFNLVLTGVTEPGSRVYVDDLELAVAANGSFEANVNLGDEEGPQVVTLRIVDRAGNEALHDVVFDVDRTPPALEVDTSPDYRDFPIVNRSAVVVQGVTEPDARVEVHRENDDAMLGSATVNSTGRWRIDITLRLGENDLIVDAFDPAGNRESFEVIRFLYDIAAPEIEVVTPPDGTVVKNSIDKLRLEARTEVDAFIWVRVNGRDLQGITMPAHGEYEVDVPLLEGNNTLVVLARDKAGNVGTFELRVVREEAGDANGDGVASSWPLILTAFVVLGAAVAAVALLLRRNVRKAG